MGYGYVLPKEFWTHRHTVGNMLHKAWTLLTAYHVSQLRESFPLNGYRDAALDQINILLGRNALDKSFVTGVGRRPVTDPHLRLTTLDGVPAGMPVKGPSYDASFKAHQKERDLAVAPAPAKNYIDEKGKHWVNEPDVEATGYFIAFAGYLASDKSSPDAPQRGPLVIRARGDCGDETMELWIEGALAQRWKNVGTAFADYTYTGFTGGEVSVHFTNDRFDPQDPGCADRNLTVDYLRACGTTYQTETSATETAECCLGDPDKLYTNGNFAFGDLPCGDDKVLSQDEPEIAQGGTIRIFPNPARGQVTIEGPLHYDLTLYDLRGSVVRYQSQRSAKSTLELAVLPPGVYLLQVLDMDSQRTYTERLIVK